MQLWTPLLLLLLLLLLPSSGVGAASELAGLEEESGVKKNRAIS